MESNKSIEGHFKYDDYEVIWIREDLPSGESVHTVTRSYGGGVDYKETLAFKDPKAAPEKFVNWTMAYACMTGEQALTFFSHLVREKEKDKESEQAALWGEVVMAAQAAQSAHRTYLDTKHDLERSPSEISAADHVYVEIKRKLVAALAELKIVKLP